LDYDDRRRTTRVTNGFGNSTLYRHNEGKVVTETIDPLGGVETNAYDANNGLLATFNALGRLRPLTVLGPESRVLSEPHVQGETGNVAPATAGDCATARVLRDGVSRVVGSQWTDRTGIAYEYEQAGNLTRVVDELGRQTRLEYDEFGKCVVVQWPSGHAVRYEYDLDDNPTAIINAKGEAHRFAYDSVGRVVGQEFFDGTRETYAYDAVGRLVGIVDGNGAATP